MQGEVDDYCFGTKRHPFYSLLFIMYVLPSPTRIKKKKGNWCKLRTVACFTTLLSSSDSAQAVTWPHWIERATFAAFGSEVPERSVWNHNSSGRYFFHTWRSTGSTGIPVPHFVTIPSMLTTQCVTRSAVLRNNGCATTSESIKECEKEYEIKRIVGKYGCYYTPSDIKHKRLQIQYARAGRHVSTTHNFWRGQRLWTVA